MTSKICQIRTLVHHYVGRCGQHKTDTPPAKSPS